MTRESIGHDLAAKLYAAESAIDKALAATATLAAALPTARSQAYLSAATGHAAFEGAASSLAALTDARGHLIVTHNTLAALARKLGLDALAIGPVDKPEDDPPIGGGGKPTARLAEQA